MLVDGLIIFLLAAIYFIASWFKRRWWVKKLDRRLIDMLRSDEFLHTDTYAISDSLREDCAEFLLARLKAAGSDKAKADVKTYYSSETGFYMLVATRAYRKLLISPLALYSALSLDAQRAYHFVYKYALEKLVALGCYDGSFYDKAEAQLKSVREFCAAQQSAGNFVEW